MDPGLVARGRGALEGLDGQDGLRAEGPATEELPAVVAGAAGDRGSESMARAGELLLLRRRRAA